MSLHHSMHTSSQGQQRSLSFVRNSHISPSWNGGQCRFQVLLKYKMCHLLPHHAQ